MLSVDLKKNKTKQKQQTTTIITFPPFVPSQVQITLIQALHEQEIPVTALLGASQNTSSENDIFCLKS